jgi:nicotinamide mononucleotide transporter
VSPLEFVAALLGLVAVWLIVRERMLAWPFGVSTGTLYVVIFAQARLYAGALLQVVYVGLQFYGWYSWWRGSAGGDRLPVSRASRRTLAVAAAVGVTGTLALGTALARHTDQALPYWDSFVTAFSLVAQWMVARKLLENWAVWFVVDLVAAGVYVALGLYFTAVLYAAYLGLAIAGWRQWQASHLARREPALREAS